MLLALFFLSSGLFLGWSLGANDAANVFGTAVGSKMIRFTTAAWICSIFVVLGAIVGGTGASHTLGELGAVDAIAGAFIVALSAAISVFLMTKAGLPVSTSQAIVGGIIGWNCYSGNPTNPVVIQKIISTWVFCPILAMMFAIVLYFFIRVILVKCKIHIFNMDVYTRIALIVAGAFGSYSLGANNIANVMGVFIHDSPFQAIPLGSITTFSSTQQLFLLGGIAIAIGVFTYSKKVMLTVGKGIFKLSPVTAFIVVLASALVLFIFSSVELKAFLTKMHLPSLPLVPVSSSQAVVGAVMGIGIAKGGRNIKLGVLGKISVGWIATPIIAAVICFVMLYFMQNVFMARVHS